MKRFFTQGALWALVVVMFASCERNNDLKPVSNDEQKQEYSVIPQHETLDQLAITFAKGLKSSESMRNLVKAEAEKKVTGDYDVLFADIAKAELKEGTVEQVNAEHAGFAKKSNPVAYLNQLAASVPNFQLSVPVNIESWNTSEYSPMVAYMPVDVDDTKVLWVKAYDAEGNIHWLDAKKDPSFPVVVIGSSERRLADGSVDLRFLIQPIEDDGGSGGGGGSTGGGSTGGTTSYHYCDRAYYTGKYDYITYAKFHNVDRKRDVEPWALGEAEMYVNVIFANAQGAVSDKKMGVWSDWGNTNWIGEYFTKEVYLNASVIKWDRSTYGDVMKYVWFEEDGGNWGTFKVSFEPKLWGISLGKVEYSLPLKNNDDWAGDDIATWTDVNNSNSKGYYYSSYYMYWYIRQK